MDRWKRSWSPRDVNSIVKIGQKPIRPNQMLIRRRQGILDCCGMAQTVPAQPRSAMRPLLPFSKIKDGNILARALIGAIREPHLILSDSLRVIAASESFLRAFKVIEQDTIGRPLDELGDAQWRSPELHLRLTNVLPHSSSFQNYEVEHDFPVIGLRKMLLNARPLHFGDGIAPAILLAMEDVTDRRRLEKDKDELQAKTQFLLNEMQHRIANSLMIIASILLLKAKSVASDETRTHLMDAHQRVRAIADIQRHLQPSFVDDRVELAPYLTSLCRSLAASMVEPGQPHRILVTADDGATTSSEAVSLGLITTELIINALKHAFLDGRVGTIDVAFTDAGSGWQLSVADDGVGLAAKAREGAVVGLGTTIIESLAKQLGGEVSTNSSAEGTRVTIKTGPLAKKIAPARVACDHMP